MRDICTMHGSLERSTLIFGKKNALKGIFNCFYVGRRWNYDESGSINMTRFSPSSLQRNNIHILCENDLDELPNKNRIEISKFETHLMELTNQYINVIDQYDPIKDKHIKNELIDQSANKLLYPDATNLTMQVGSKYNQYPNISHKNIETILKYIFDNKSDSKLWYFNKNIKKQWNPISLETIYDYCNNNNINNNTDNNINWELIENNNNNNKLNDSYLSNMPYLQLKKNDKIIGEILIFRDIHNKISNLYKIENICKIYKPDIIFLESCFDNNMPIINKLHKKNLILNNYLNILKYFFSTLYYFDIKLNNNKFGNFLLYFQSIIFNDYNNMLSSSYALNGLLNYYSKNLNNFNIYLPKNIIMADLLFDYVAILIYFSKYLDCYQLTIFSNKFDLKYILNIFENLHNFMSDNIITNNDYIKLSKLSLKLSELLTPHNLIMQNYRNEYMSLVLKNITKKLINEYNNNNNNNNNKSFINKKILCLWGDSHTIDLINRLIGNKQTLNVFDNINDNLIKIKSIIPQNYLNYNKNCNKNYWNNEIGDLEKQFLKNQFNDKFKDFIQFCSKLENDSKTKPF